MATQVTRSLKEINAEIKTLDTSIKALEKDNRSMARSMRYDGHNTPLITEQTRVLKEAIAQATQKVQSLRQAQVEMAKSPLTTQTAEEFNAMNVEIGKTIAKVNQFKAELKKVAELRFAKLEASLRKVGAVATKIVAGVIALGTAFAITGDKIQKASSRFRISTEDFQRGSFVFQRVTGDADSYKNALENVVTMMKQLAEGSGSATTNFARFGMTAADFAGKSPAEALDLITSKLQQIGDSSERTKMATLLLGDQGVALSQVAGLTASELQNLNQIIEDQGILTQEEVEQAEKLKEAFDALKIAFKKVMAELSVALVPMFEALLGVAQQIIPVITWLAESFKKLGPELQTTVTLFLVALIILPKLIIIIKAMATTIGVLKTVFLAVKASIWGANVAATAFSANPVGLTIIAITLAVVALIVALIALAKWLGKIFNKKYSLDIEAPSLGIRAPEFGNQLVGSAGEAGKAYDIRGKETDQDLNYVTYYDYSTQNNTVTEQADIDDIASQLRDKIRVGGAK